MHRGQAEPGAAGIAPRGEERFENMRQRLGRNAGAGVLHLHHHVAAGRNRLRPARQRPVQRQLAGVKRQRAALRHRVARVHREVHQHLIERRRIDPHQLPGLLQRHFQPHPVAEQPPQHGGEFAHHRVQRQHPRLERLLPAERQQMPHQRRPALRAGADHLDVLQRLVVQPVVRGDRVRAADDRGQQVVEVVRHAAGKLPGRLQPLALRKLRLQPRLHGDVVHRQQHPVGRGAEADQRRTGDGGGHRHVGVADQLRGQRPGRPRPGGAVQDGGNLAPRGVAVGLGEQQLHRRAGRQIERGTDHALQQGAGAHHPPVPVGHETPGGGVLKQQPQRRVQRAGEPVDQAQAERRRGREQAAQPGQRAGHAARFRSRHT